MSPRSGTTFRTSTQDVWGLVAAGAASRSCLARMPAFVSRLGPIKATSFQVSRRLKNSLRAGFAVSHFSALEFCTMVWILVPELMLDRVIRDLAAQTPIHRTMIVLCESVRDSMSLTNLRAAGARVASLSTVEQSQEKLFVAEGHPDTLAILRRLLSAEKRRLVELLPDGKPLYIAGVHMAKYLSLPAIAASVEILRAAGFARAQAARMAETWVSRSAAAYAKAGPQSWSPLAPEELRRTLEDHRETLQQTDPRLAAVYSEGAHTALTYFRKR